MMKVIAVLSARGRGSTLPKKNIHPINGKPMLWHFLKEMKKCSFLDEICVWTESEEVGEVAREFGCHILERPREMVHYGAGFFTIDEWRKCVSDQLLDRYGTAGNIQVHLNCNHVLFRAETLEAMFDKLMEDENATVIYPMYKVDPHLYMVNPNTNYLFPVWDSPGMDRQKFPQLYRKVDIYIRHALRPKLPGDKELFHIIPWHEGRDIQGEEDLEFAGYMLSKRDGK